MADQGVPASPDPGSSSDNDIDMSASALVGWDSDRSLFEATFDARRVGATADAFLKLRTTVLLKASAPRKTPVFIFIHPERVRALRLCELEVDQRAHQEEACRRLGTDVACMRFTLSKPVDLVGPKESDLTPKNKASGDILDSLRCLARQDDFTVYFPRNVLSRARLVSLCAAASSGELKSIARQADLNSLYRGKGGRVISQPETAHDAAPGPSSPPSYDELGPSPPLAPLDAPSGHTLKKRRRDDSDDVGSCRQGPVDVERMCRKIVEEQKAEMLRLVEEQQNKLYERLLADLKPHIGQELEKMETRILDHIEERAGKQAAKQKEHLEQRLDKVRDDVSDEIASRVGDVDEKVEDEFYGLRLRLEDYIQEELTEAEARMVDHLESSATISLSFA